MSINFIRDYESQETIDLFSSIMMKDEPLFFGRIGGQEYDTASRHYAYNGHFDNEEIYDFTISLLRKYAGYFDLSNSKDVFYQYANALASCYKKMEYVFYANPSLITPIQSGTIPYDPLLLDILEGKTAFCYGFMEGVTPFMDSFKTWGEGKKILVVSPFEESLKYQYARRYKIMNNYTYPNFELVTYKTKILYNDGTETKEQLGTTTNNWEEEWMRMAEEISKLDFDIAWLSCAAYSPFLGDYIVHTMGKKAIYVGGILNMFFNIYGERFKAYTSYCNIDYMIDPFENKEIENMTAGRGQAYEGIHAYFGYKNK